MVGSQSCFDCEFCQDYGNTDAAVSIDYISGKDILSDFDYVICSNPDRWF